MIQQLREKVLEANLALVSNGLVINTWGNVSGIDRDHGLIAIKPSGVAYAKMKLADIVVMDLEGRIVEGKLNPSSDTPTHLVLYKHFKKIGGIVHTHSEWATSWAQAKTGIPAFGTTHADYFYGEIPCTRELSSEEVLKEYEKSTGDVIVERFKDVDYTAVPAVLVCGHAPFTWGKDPDDAVQNAVFLEEVAKMAFRTQVLGNKKPLDQFLLDKHYLRKHGKNSYYGQKK